jgi:hypothetical protein
LLAENGLLVSSTIATVLIRTVVPVRIRKSIRSLHQRYVYHHAFKQFARNPYKCTDPGSVTLSRLVYGWGNSSWSAQPEYLSACITKALTCNGAILECGSGLTTILVGYIAMMRNINLVSLEHDRDWARRVEGSIAEHSITLTTIVCSDLKDYNLFSWYDISAGLIPSGIGLVVCDGPPGHTKGGRIGLLPLISERLREDSIILFDDSSRIGEKSVLDSWIGDFCVSVTTHGLIKEYAEINFIGTPARG